VVETVKEKAESPFVKEPEPPKMLVRVNKLPEKEQAPEVLAGLPALVMEQAVFTTGRLSGNSMVIVLAEGIE
jgi:hypothetical protein